MTRAKASNPAEYQTETKRTAEITRAMRVLGKIGGLARASKLTPERRLEIATKASRAAAQARSKKNPEPPKEGAVPFATSADELCNGQESARCSPRVDPALDLMRFFKSELLPAELADFCTLRRTLDARLAGSFRGTLTDVEAKIYTVEGLRSPIIRNKWDERIIDAAGRYGTLILLSDLVLRRVHVWRTGFGDSGPNLQMLRRFLEAILAESEVRWGRKQDAISEDYARYKPTVVAELKGLQRELQKSALHTPQEIIELARRLLSGDEYRGLTVNRTPLFIFLEAKPNIALGFGGGTARLRTESQDPIERVSATDFYYHFVAHCTNRTYETVRQEISRLSVEIKHREK